MNYLKKYNLLYKSNIHIVFSNAPRKRLQKTFDEKKPREQVPFTNGTNLASRIWIDAYDELMGDIYTNSSMAPHLHKENITRLTL